MVEMIIYWGIPSVSREHDLYIVLFLLDRTMQFNRLDYFVDSA